jgi:hypothetical protein
VKGKQSALQGTKKEMRRSPTISETIIVFSFFALTSYQPPKSSAGGRTALQGGSISVQILHT